MTLILDLSAARSLDDALREAAGAILNTLTERPAK